MKKTQLITNQLPIYTEKMHRIDPSLRKKWPENYHFRRSKRFLVKIDWKTPFFFEDRLIFPEFFKNRAISTEILLKMHPSLQNLGW